MNGFIAQHWVASLAVGAYLGSGLVATEPAKGSDFSKFATWYGWFYDFTHIIVNSKGEKVIPAPPVPPVV